MPRGLFSVVADHGIIEEAGDLETAKEFLENAWPSYYDWKSVKRTATLTHIECSECRELVPVDEVDESRLCKECQKQTGGILDHAHYTLEA